MKACHKVEETWNIYLEQSFSVNSVLFKDLFIKAKQNLSDDQTNGH